jgi:hypothetical protein
MSAKKTTLKVETAKKFTINGTAARMVISFVVPKHELTASSQRLRKR